MDVVIQLNFLPEIYAKIPATKERTDVIATSVPPETIHPIDVPISKIPDCLGLPRIIEENTIIKSVSRIAKMPIIPTDWSDDMAETSPPINNVINARPKPIIPEIRPSTNAAVFMYLTP